LLSKNTTPDKEQRIVITGANGFFGRYIVMRLFSIGYKKIVGIFRRKDVPIELQNISMVHASFGDVDALRDTLQENDIVIHCACSAFPSDSECCTEKDVEENVIGCLKLLRICKEKQVRKFIFLSSGGTIYGDCGNSAAVETQPVNPMNSHGVMKLAIEYYLRVNQRIYGLPYVILRVGNAYGNESLEDRSQGFIDAALRAIVLGRPVDVWGDGTIVRDYVFIEDIADAVAKSLGNVVNETFNIGSGKGFSILEALAAIEQATNKAPEVTFSPGRPFDLNRNVLDIGRAESLLSWKPSTTLVEGIAHTYAKMCAQGVTVR